ncbi:MAG: M1 family aminopeptidase [Bacteroidales bacterium]|nr:M1 family aminopeptidase [Bacteroidales bacterium]
MKKHLANILVAALILAVESSFSSLCAVNEAGVSHTLAQERSQSVDSLRYHLRFHIPSSKAEPIRGQVDMTLFYSSAQPLVIDFCGDWVDSVALVDEAPVKISWEDEHIIIPSEVLGRGSHTISLQFVSADGSLNRHDDYLYTLFVPANARSVFPCLDQPDLKARYTLELDLPEGWISRSTSPLGEATPPLPSYLFSFVAGRFQEWTDTTAFPTITLLYRETDPEKVGQLPEIGQEARLALQWLEEYTGIECPWPQHGFVILPGYQFGGMEHPGAIQLNANTIFLGPNATTEEREKRFELIAHETAHLWFGDLVTMRWFSDVWTKEVFANFMASKMAREQWPKAPHDLSFLRMYQGPAMATDRTDGTHPIHQELDNLNAAGLLYGNIIYDKAPVMMRHLEDYIGATALREGLCAYLQRYAFANSSWDELVAILDSVAPERDAEGFSHAWVKEAGMPRYRIEPMGDSLVILTEDPRGRGLIWPQKAQIGRLVGREVVSYPVELVVEETTIGCSPDSLLVNLDGKGYGQWEMASPLSTYQAAWPALTDEQRYAAAMILYENNRMGLLPASELAPFLAEKLATEGNEAVANAMADYLTRLVWEMDGASRSEWEQRLWDMSQGAMLPSVELKLLRGLSVWACDSTVAENLYHLWSTGSHPRLDPRDFMTLAYHLARIMPQRSPEILSAQRQRLSNADMIAEWDFISRACTPDSVARAALFESLLEADNRRIEPWTATLLGLLCDETYPDESLLYLKQGLESLEDVQQTGDIFFPTYWLRALLGYQRSGEAIEIVDGYIASHPDLNPALLRKLREAAYPLRALHQQ